MTPASRWARQRVAAFDLETTGTNAHTDRIVTAALVDIHPGIRRPIIDTWLTDPAIPIPEEAAAVHGWTTEKIAASPDKVDPGQALFEITGRLARALGQGIPIVGYNLAYDLTMLEAENTRHDVDTLASRLDKPVAPIIDALVLDKHADPYRKGSRKLGDVCAHYKVVHTGLHDSAGDALAAARLWHRIIDTHPDQFAGLNLAGLHVAQQQWRAEQMKSLRAYFYRAGKEHDGCCGEWPIHVRCTPAEAVI